jgi:hypothetical protein
MKEDNMVKNYFIAIILFIFLMFLTDRSCMLVSSKSDFDLLLGIGGLSIVGLILIYFGLKTVNYFKRRLNS